MRPFAPSFCQPALQKLSLSPLFSATTPSPAIAGNPKNDATALPRLSHPKERIQEGSKQDVADCQKDRFPKETADGGSCRPGRSRCGEFLLADHNPDRTSKRENHRQAEQGHISTKEAKRALRYDRAPNIDQERSNQSRQQTQRHPHPPRETGRANRRWRRFSFRRHGFHSDRIMRPARRTAALDFTAGQSRKSTSRKKQRVHGGREIPCPDHAPGSNCIIGYGPDYCGGCGGCGGGGGG